MAERFSLKDHLFNERSIGDLAREYAAGIDGFDPARFQADVLAGFADRELLERLDWIADCLEPYLPTDFAAMADALEASMPPQLDPTLTDDDFGRFIHAVPGIMAVRHGLEHHRERALDLIHSATKRFSMEFYIRPFLNRWPDETLARLKHWTKDPNYHVRRLVSEGTRHRLPWAKSVELTPDQTLPLLDALHGDPTRYVTRSVANHLNDLTRVVPDRVLSRLADWADQDAQEAGELDWMRRHALRTLVKDGHAGAMAALGFDPKAPVECTISVQTATAKIGQMLAFSATLSAAKDTGVLVDYLLHVPSGSGKTRVKVFKLKQARIKAGTPLVLSKSHKLKGDATTFSLGPGPGRIELQVNGTLRASAAFTLIS